MSPIATTPPKEYAEVFVNMVASITGISKTWSKARCVLRAQPGNYVGRSWESGKDGSHPLFQLDGSLFTKLLGSQLNSP